MDNARLIGLSRQIALKRQMNVIAHNMANTGTAGFKSDRLLFQEYLMPVARVEDMTGGDRALSYVLDSGMVRNLADGPMERTGNELDVAVFGDGWLVVQTPGGERYTRNGQFKLDSDGQLITSEGLPVLSDSGPVTFEGEETGITFARDGTISSSAGEKGKLRLVRFENNQALRKEGNSLYASEEDALPVETPRIEQGMFEKSNVESIQEMTRMVEVVRAYTSMAKMMARSDQMRRDSINKLARVPT